MQANIKTALVKNLRGLATNLKGLTDQQLAENATNVREFTELLENLIAGLNEHGQFGLSTPEYADMKKSYESAHDENATLRAELGELREALIESNEIRESLRLIAEDLKTLTIRNQPHNG